MNRLAKDRIDLEELTEESHSVAEPNLQSTITCPECGHQRAETMPTDACWYFYDCAACGALLKPKQGDCCVFCSYGTVACPPIQMQKPCC